MKPGRLLAYGVFFVLGFWLLGVLEERERRRV